MINICLFGPESVGKTTLAVKLAKIFGGEFVPEVSRRLLSSNKFTLADIVKIGKAQTKAILQANKQKTSIVFCDTDLITTAIYSKTYLNKVPELLLSLEKKIHFDQYFLLDIDVPWVPDGLRDLGNKREEMYTIFKNELESRGIKYVKVSGNWVERENTVIDFIAQNFSIFPIIKNNSH